MPSRYSIAKKKIADLVIGHIRGIGGSNKIGLDTLLSELGLTSAADLEA
jgi:hypothetical protein